MPPTIATIASAEISACEDIVAVIDGIPRTFEQLEQLAAADRAYAEDFPETAPAADAGIEDIEDDAEPLDAERLAAGESPCTRRDYAFTAMGAALMVLVAVLATRVPIVEQPADPGRAKRPDAGAEGLVADECG